MWLNMFLRVRCFKISYKIEVLMLGVIFQMGTDEVYHDLHPSVGVEGSLFSDTPNGDQ